MTGFASKRAMIMNKINDNELPLSEQYRIIAKKWVDADSAA